MKLARSARPISPICAAPWMEASRDGATELTLDFSRLDCISSAGLRVLLSANKVMSKKSGMKVVHVNEIVKEVFEVTGFTVILTIE